MGTGGEIELELAEAIKILYSRIIALEPKAITDIIMDHILTNNSIPQVITLARAPDPVIHYLIRTITPLLPLGAHGSFNPGPSCSCSSCPSSSYTLHPSNPDFLRSFEDYISQNQSQYVDLDAHLDSTLGYPNDFDHLESTFGNLRVRNTSRNSGVKVCHYYNKGNCKHGEKCRYFHGQPMVSPTLSNEDGSNEDQVVSPGSLVKLEREIMELLRSLGGKTVSIANLPTIYYMKFGKNLQAEGYLTESQRHGKSGYSLTKLLARLKNIRIIDRPHGQHALILAEDAARFTENRSERPDPGPIVSGSRQIYLTFPADSVFTEQDVSRYFSAFGAVEDVRIPSQHKRMFGFVTFASAVTVRTILSKANAHRVCGARVLVKPYREKPRHFERKYNDESESPVYYLRQHIYLEPPELEYTGWDAASLIQQQSMENQLALEFARTHLSRPAMDPMRNPEDTFPSSHGESVLNPNPADANFSDHQNNDKEVNLPDSLFSVPVFEGMHISGSCYNNA